MANTFIWVMTMKSKKTAPILLILILNLIFPGFIFAQERLAVMNLKAGEGIGQELGDTISEEIRNQIHKLGIFEVVSQEDVEEIALRTAAQQKIGCDDDNQCLILFGNKLNSRFMVAGSLAKLKDKYHLAVRLLDTVGKEAGAKARESRTCSCSKDELLQVGRVLAAKMIYHYYKENPPGKDASSIVLDMHKTKVESLEAVLEQTREDNIIDEDRGFISRYKWWILGGLVVVAGGAAAASGGGGGGDSTEQQPASNTETGPVAVTW